MEIISHFPELESLNFGGGFTYLFGGEEITAFFSLISQALGNYLENGLEILFEPGMLLFIFSGYLKASVIDCSKGSLTLNASAWNLHSWYPSNLVYSTADAQKDHEYNVYGNTCYEKDIFFTGIALPKIQLDDVLVLFPYGSYVNSMHRNLHGNALPPEYLYKDKSFRRI
ncbi:Diaminopimelate decarboxylase [compost metagenome]